jgi:hypothetical protein
MSEIGKMVFLKITHSKYNYTSIDLFAKKVSISIIAANQNCKVTVTCLVEIHSLVII